MIPTWGTSSGRNGAGGIPSLLLDFSNQSYLLNGTGYAAFGGSPGITFLRGTNATMIDSTGTLTYAPSNQILNSESFTATSWAGVGTTGLSSVGSNATVAPDGTTTADSLVEDSLTSDHRINQSGISGSAGAGKYAFSVYLKAGTRTFARIQFDGTINAVGSSCGVNVNLLDGSFSTPTNAGNITSATATVTDVGNGWYRVGLLATLSTAYSFTGASVRIFTMQSLAGSTSFLGNGSNIFVWGAQFGAMTYETAPRTYNSTTPKNLLGYTEEFNNAAWAKSNATVTANAITDPNGYLNADKLVEDTATSEHFADQSFLIVTNNIYTFSAYLKAGERNQAVMRFTTGTSWSGGTVQVIFTLTGAGSNSTLSGFPITISITSVGNGWYRCSISAITIAAASPAARIQLYNTALATTNYTGDGTSGIYVWGAQVSDSASVDPYVYNPAAALTSTVYYGPRFDYDPVTLAPLGLLIEEARTNGSYPSTNWSTNAGAGLTATNNYAVAPDGTTSGMRLQWTGTTGSYRYGSVITNTAAIPYTSSIFIKANAASQITLFMGANDGSTVSNASFNTSTLAVTTSFNNANGNLITGVSASVTAYVNNWYRITLTATNSLSMVNFTAGVVVQVAAAGDVNVWGVQLEAGAFATSYIPTVSASVTRSADNATMVGNNFSNWYNQNNGTFSVTMEASANANAEYLEVCDVSNASNSFYFDNAGGSMRNIVASGGSVVAILNLSAVGAVGATNKLAGAYAFNDFAASRNGGTVAIDSGGAVPVGALQMNIGRSVNAVASTYIDGHIKSVSYYNTRLLDAQLQALTA